MLNHNQNGASTGIILSLTLCIILLVASFAFGIWAYGSRQDYKNNVNSKVGVAVTAAKASQESSDNATFQRKSQLPLTSYSGPEAYGSLVLQYPKNWSGYVDASGEASNNGEAAVINGYFNPGVVPSVTEQGSIFALRMEILSQSYATTLQSLSGAPGVSTSVYTLPKLPNVIGVEATGAVNPENANETMVILPDRSATIEIWTDGTQFVSEFNSIILANFSFSP
jgi:hypothetical protein